MITGEGRGQSSVIAVVLLVGVTVILASVVTTLALGLTEKTDSSPPDVVWSTKEQPHQFVTGRDGDASVRFTLESGETIPNPNENLQIVYDGDATFSTASDEHKATDPDDGIIRRTEVTVTEDLTAGDSLNVTLSCCRASLALGDVDDVENGDTVYIVWVGEKSNEGAVIARHTFSNL